MRSEEPQWEWAQRILENTLGKNPLGSPLYRFVWGEDRLEWVGQKWEDKDGNGTLIREIIEQRLIPKYSHLGSECWFVERWYPPEHYGTREEWESKVVEREDGITIPARGPYPRQGDYEFAWRMEGPNGEFRQLTISRVEWIAAVIKDAEERTAAARFAAQQAVHEIAKQVQYEIDLELLNDATPAFKGKLRRGTAVVIP